MSDQENGPRDAGHFCLGAPQLREQTANGRPVDILPFDEEDAAHAGDIRAKLERKGTPIRVL
ncbi:hypothetical protein [Bradyrhizobium guangdongense]|uniref:hypothetical protein n=1 Tax=Bradyrhizobium guangdongense TaxID=1325090 RepID=UPI001FEE8180|nr:hypothetical protein [Bradyrhizobium guangdongense]